MALVFSGHFCYITGMRRVAPFKTCRKPLHGQVAGWGFSLIEVIIAMSIFAITAAGVFSAIVQASMMTEAVANELEATMLLNNEMEHLRGLDWPQVEALKTKDTFDTPSAKAQFNTVRLVATPVSGQREVKLQVSWSDSKDKQFSTSVVTLLTEYD